MLGNQQRHERWSRQTRTNPLPRVAGGPPYEIVLTQGCIKPLCDLLSSMDNKIIQVALDGLENILRVGEADRGDPPVPGSINKYALFIEEANGMEKIHECQQNANQEIYKKAYHIIDTYPPMCSV
jgi:importin subunit alpha-6/7